MQARCTIKWLLFLLTILESVRTFEIVIQQTDGTKNQKIEHLKIFRNKTYELPLFQKRLITLRIHPDDLRRNKQSNEFDVVGFKFQVQASDTHVVEVRKELRVPTKLTHTNETTNIILEDLFILPRKNALGHIFNAYPSPTLINLKNPRNIEIIWSMKSIRMEETILTFTLDVFHNDDSSSTYIQHLNVLVIQPKRAIDLAFHIILPFLVIFISTQMGILLDTKVLIQLVKKPKPVLIGFLSQYGLMPFLAMAIAKIFRYTPLYSLALFVIGCCPGSGASNQWTLLFDGDVNLSAVMSFVSTASSFVMMPLYFYTLGRIYMNELSIRVPFLGLVRSLALVVVPYGLGILISHFSPKTRMFVEKMVKPMMLFLLIFFLVFGTIVNWYLIEIIDLYTALTAPLLPYLGFTFGALFAWICGLDWIHVKTVGIEAGIQNVGVAFMIIYYSFPQPYASKAIVVPLVVAFLTTKPFWLAYVIRNRMIQYRKSKESKTPNGDLTLVDEKPCWNTDENHDNEDNAAGKQNL